MKKLIKTTKNYISLNKKATIIIIVLLILGFVVGSLVAKSGSDEETTEERQGRSVEIASVATLSQNGGALPLLGQVESVSEAVIRTESQGEIKRVTKSLGDYVRAGEVIAEFENSLERASVAQAEARVEQAEASSNISTSQLGNSEASFTEAKINAINTLKSAYASADSVVRKDVDAFLLNENTVSPELMFNPPDYQLRVNIESGRTTLEQILKDWQIEIDSLTVNSDIEAALNNGEANISFLRNYLDDAGLALNTYNPGTTEQSTVAGWRASIQGARTTASGVASSISGAKDRYNGAKTALAVSQNDATSNSGGATIASANLKQAQAGLAQAQAALEKTIVRSPISGTLNSFTLKRGDFVGAFQEVAVVANNNALEVIAYITEQDRSRVSVGSVVKVAGSEDGVVTKVAPALDPLTKKIEVKIGFNGAQPAITNGQSIRLEIVQDTKEASEVTDIIIPISALKIESAGTFVFTVDEESKLIGHEVEVGSLLGQRVKVLSGITSDMFIVTDARGLKAGQEVSVSE